MTRVKATTTSHLVPIRYVSVRDMRIVRVRPHRLTLEWVLDEQPTSGWIDRFQSAIEAMVGPERRGSRAYGLPIVLEEAKILWAVGDADVASAIPFVEMSVAHANAAAQNRKSAEDRQAGQTGHRATCHPSVIPKSESSPAEFTGSVVPIGDGAKASGARWPRTPRGRPGQGENGEGPLAG
jgi:hypothetical protein